MGSLSLDLYRRNKMNASSKQFYWESWGYVISGQEVGSIGTNNYGKFMVCLRAYVNYASASELTSLDLSLYLYTPSSGDVSIYLYTSDPTNGSAGSVPTGYVASLTKAVTTTSTANLYYFDIGNLNITSSYVYILIAREGVSTHVLDPTATGGFQQPISMSLSSASVTTGSNQVATFTNGSGRSVSVSVKFNNTTLWTGSTTSGSLTIPVSKAWFSTAGNTTYREIPVSIQATEAYTGTISDSFYIVAGSDMNPTVGTPTVSIEQAPGKPTTNFPSTYLANISKAKISVSVASGSNASIASVVLTYTGGSTIPMTYINETGKWEATTPELASASTTFTVTATDGRKYNRSSTDVGGMSAAATTSAISVVQYSPPSVNVDAGATFRCKQNGTQDSGGAFFMAKAAATYYSALTGNSLLEFTVKVQGTQTAYPLTSGVQTTQLDGTLVATTNYTLEFVIEDKVSAAVTKSFPLGSQVRDIVAIHNSTGTALGVGTTPQRQAGSSVETARGGDFLLGGFFAQAFPFQSISDGDGSSFGKDFLNVERYDSRADENASTLFGISGGSSGWSNLPSAVVGEDWYGYRMVLRCSRVIYGVVILEMNPTPGRIWVNVHNAFGWSGWKSLTPA